MQLKKFQGLFVKAVVVLVLISLVPVLMISYRVMKINSRLLQNQLLQKQQTQADKLAAAVHHVIFSKEQLLSEFADLHTAFGSHDLITQPDLTYLHARTASLFYLVVFSANGVRLFDTGERPQGDWSAIQETMMQTGLKGEQFVSPVFYEDNKPFVWLSEPLHRQFGADRVTGVLAAALYLEDVFQALSQACPPDMEALLVTQQGDILSYNGIPATEGGSDVTSQLPEITRQLAGAESGEIVSRNGEKWLIASARVSDLGWTVYILQPASLVPQLFKDSLLHSSFWDLAVIFIGMFLFVCGISYLVIIPITRPLEQLRRAAVRLRENENAVISREDIKIPHNEIGELASVFVEMSQTLYQRRQELIKTQQELAQMNQILERRVVQRTRELEKATGELVKAERLAAIGQMASIISHEIRNPLAVISNAARLIKTLVRPTEQKVIKQFSIIEAEIRQANSIISEVLGYARTRELIFSTIDVNSYLRDLVATAPIPPAIKVQLQLEEPGVQIKVDAEEIKQALRNILANAVEAMPTGGTVTVGARAGKRAVRLYIQDTGTGITEEVRKEMFSPFFTTKARGTGLGLAVVRKAVQRHGGKLRISSQLGKGTCFCVYLKIYRKKGDTNYGTIS